MLPSFRLNSWELPPGSPQPLEGRAQVRVRAAWLGRKSAFWVRVVEIAPFEFVPFVRAHGAREGDNWVLGRDDYAPSLFSSARPFDDVQALLERDHHALHVLRLVHLDAARFGFEGEVRAVFNGRRGRLLLYTPREKSSEREQAFHLDAPLTNPADTPEVLALALDDPQSDARFALEFAAKNHRERLNCALEFERGSLDELEHLLGLVLQLGSWREERAQLWSLSRANEAEIDAPWGDHLLRELDAETSAGARLQPLHRAWRRALLGHFAPRPNARLQLRHLCLEEFWSGQRIGPRKFAFGRAGRPTQHERLEAALTLREWLKANAPDQIHELLPPDLFS